MALVAAACCAMLGKLRLLRENFVLSVLDLLCGSYLTACSHLDETSANVHAWNYFQHDVRAQPGSWGRYLAACRRLGESSYMHEATSSVCARGVGETLNFHRIRCLPHDLGSVVSLDFVAEFSQFADVEASSAES